MAREGKPGSEARSGVAREGKPGSEARSGVAREGKPGSEARSGVAREGKPGSEARSGVAREGKPGSEARSDSKWCRLQLGPDPWLKYSIAMYKAGLSMYSDTIDTAHTDTHTSPRTPLTAHTSPRTPSLHTPHQEPPRCTHLTKNPLAAHTSPRAPMNPL